MEWSMFFTTSRQATCRICSKGSQLDEPKCRRKPIKLYIYMYGKLLSILENVKYCQANT